MELWRRSLTALWCASNPKNILEKVVQFFFLSENHRGDEQRARGRTESEGSNRKRGDEQKRGVCALGRVRALAGVLRPPSANK